MQQSKQRNFKILKVRVQGDAISDICVIVFVLRLINDEDTNSTSSVSPNAPLIANINEKTVIIDKCRYKLLYTYNIYVNSK